MFLRVWFIIVGVYLTQAVKGCELSCGGVKHTMCEYPSGGGDSCQEYQGGMTPEEVKMLVDLHNEIRQRVATGEIPAGDMREIVWDPRASVVAQRWADQCREVGHDRCRTVPGVTYVGQNVCLIRGYDSSGASPSRQEALSTCLTEWYKEIENFRGSVDNFNPDPVEVSKIGHYTQLVWASTDRVGCGLSQYAKGAEYQYRLVCNYLPGGNIKNERIYIERGPCTECPVNTSCSHQWPGLCAGTTQEGIIIPHSETVLGGDAGEDTPRDEPTPDIGCPGTSINLTLSLLTLLISLQHHINMIL